MKIENFNKNAIIFEGKKVSYEDLINNIGSFSLNFDISKQERVVLFCENRPEWIYSLFGIWQKGGIGVLIDYLSNASELSYILNDANPKIILVSKTTLEVTKEALKIYSKNIKLILIDDIELKDINFTQKKLISSDIALMPYTSGTTGNPKGVVLTFKNLYSNINSLKKIKIATKEDAVISLLPFHHSYPLITTLLAPLAVGSTISIVRDISSDSIIKTLQNDKISIFIGVPRLFDLFHKAIMEKVNSNIATKTLFKLAKNIDSIAFSKIIFNKAHQRFGGNIKYFVSGGAKLDFEVMSDFKALGFRVIEGYGLTETSPIISFNPPKKIKIGSVGKPIDRVEIKFIDGEIVVKGDNVTKGYYNLREKTNEAIKDGWFYTGDLGELDSDGYLYITGRKKDMIVLGSGKNINPEELENSLIKVSNFVKEVGVISKDGNLFAIIYPNHQALKDTLNIQEKIRWAVIDVYNLKASSYKKINGFKVVNSELPKTRLGKIKHYKLKEFLNEDSKKIVENEPKDEVYEVLKNYLAKVNNKSVAPKDNIEIDLGFDSLAKIELLTFIDSAFGIEMDEESLTKYLIVEELYNFIKDRNSKIEDGEINWEKIISKEVDFNIPKHEKTLRIFSAFSNFIFKLYFRIEVNGLENLPKKPYIIAPNHQSFLDGFLIIASLPNEVLKDSYTIADEHFFNTLLKKSIADYSQIIPININSNLKIALQKSVKVLKDNKNIVIFPEGARSRDGKLLEFKKLFAILAKELNTPIVPVAIEGAFKAFPFGAIIPRPSKIKITFLKPIEPKGSYEEIRDSVKSEIESKI